MKWIEQSLIKDYGKLRWERFSDEEQILIIAEFTKNYIGAKRYLTHLSNSEK